MAKVREYERSRQWCVAGTGIRVEANGIVTGKLQGTHEELAYDNGEKKNP